MLDRKSPRRINFTLGMTAAWLTACAGPGAEDSGQPDGSFDHVVLVTIDTLRADHLGAYGYPRPVSPFLDSLADRGVLFERAISSSSHTAPSHATMFTSLYPAQHRVLANGMELDPEIATLASRFRAEGFETTAVISARFLAAVTPGFSQVFVKRPKPVGAWPGDRVVDRAIAWHALRQDDRPFFLWLHLFDVHETRGKRAWAVPRDLALELRSQYEADPEPIREAWRLHGYSDEAIASPEALHNYDAQIRSVDRELSRFYEYLGSHEKGSVLWVVTADHGEGLSNHGTYGHGIHIYQEQIRVPLILHGDEEWSAGRRVPNLVRHVDVLPTLADLIGLEMDSGEIEGRSLRPLLMGNVGSWNEEPAFAQRRPANQARLEAGWPPGPVVALQDSRYKYILKAGGDHEFYDLESDPLELNNLIDGSSPEKDRLAKILAEKYSTLLARAEQDDDQPTQIEEELVEELRALGYI